MRRNKVQQLLVRGYGQWEVADELQIDQSTIIRDSQYLNQQAQESLVSEAWVTWEQKSPTH